MSFRTAAICTAIALVATACGGEGGSAGQPADGKIKVVASTNVWGSVLSAVGGDKVALTSIINDPSGDPHSYETTPADAVAVQDAKLALYNGGGYDTFFTKLSDQAPGVRKLVAFDISGKAGEGHTDAGEAEAEHGHSEVNEHVWYDFATVDKVADQVAAQLGELQPDAKAAFDSNAGAFKAKVAELRAKTEQAGAKQPGAKVIATEPVAHYLLETAKVEDATPPEFSEAIEEETDVPAGALDQVHQLVDGKQVKAVVNNAQTTTPVTDQVIAKAKNVGLPVVDVTETLPAGVTDYIAWMSKEVDALAGALGS
ncbi:metal ABC transporter solute-binding protein, Zn/Mn family [Amycolatopsis nigrescens]|uniref:metal ABC transporter solute-binding protein, Zn/Mn family n=1 Tax=Amycolatopsis nigrescens TaxID=381445 RepID=UPI0003750FFE|nr:zinc ABC transporter substrate-binding protein [Amycolatopsis nigrescens]